jgi:hypothetical protein
MLRHTRWRPRRAGLDQRPPGLSVLRLRTRCHPWPCGRLPTSDYDGGDHQPRWACPRPTWLASVEGGRGMVPTFNASRSTGSRPSSSLAASPRRPAAFHRGLQFGQSWTSPKRRQQQCHRLCTADRPASIRFEPTGADDDDRIGQTRWASEMISRTRCRPRGQAGAQRRSASAADGDSPTLPLAMAESV